MNNNYMYISKSIISIILCLIFLSTFNHNIYASSEFLKTNTEIKYEELIKCIKSHNNDISKCIDHYKSYLKNEIKLIKSTSKNDIYNKRLTKMITYLQKSTDVYHKKAKKNNNLIYWEKAANCAKLLSNISKKYSDYKIIVESYKQAKRGPSLSIHLKQKMKALDKYEYPSYEYLKELKRYVNNINNNLAVFKKVTVAELIKVGENVIQENLEFFKYKLKSTKRHDLTIYDNAHLRYKIFQAAIKLPNIEKTKLENLNKTIKSTTKAFNIFTDYTLNLVYKNKEYYLNDKYEKFLDSSKKVFDISPKYIKTYKSISDQNQVYSNVKILNNSKIKQISLYNNFFHIVYNAYQHKIKNEYIKSVSNYKTAMHTINANQELYSKTKENYKGAINQTFNHITKTFETAIDKKEYLNAFDILNVNLEFTDQQKNKLRQKKRKIINLYTENSLNNINKLVKNRKFDALLKYINTLESKYFNNNQRERIFQQAIKSIKFYANTQ